MRYFFIRRAYLFVIPIVLLMFGLMIEQEVDWRVFSALSHSSQSVSLDDMAIVDIPNNDDLLKFRAGVGGFLSFLAHQKSVPKAVVLDMWFQKDGEFVFSDHPCEIGHAERPAGIAELELGLCELKEREVPVYAAVNVFDKNGNPLPDYMKQHVEEIYQILLEGSGHTRLDKHGGIIKYDPQISVGGGVFVSALPVKLSEDLFHRSVAEVNEPIIIAAGSNFDLTSKVVTFDVGKFISFKENSALPNELNVKNQLVLVGSFANDYWKEASRHGPELLGWAIAERTASVDNASSQIHLLKSPAREMLFYILLLTMPVLTFVSCFYFYKSKEEWRIRPAIPSALAVCVSIAGFLLVTLGLSWQLGTIFPQVTLIVLMMLSAGIMFWLYIWLDISKLSNHQLNRKSDAFEIFISYTTRSSMYGAEWINKELYEPIKAVVPDGTKIFFDKSSITLWSDWEKLIEEGLLDCRIFVVVITNEYFESEFCRHELSVALRRLELKHCRMVLISSVDRQLPWYSGLNKANKIQQFKNLDSFESDPQVKDKVINSIVNELDVFSGQVK